MPTNAVYYVGGRGTKLVLYSSLRKVFKKAPERGEIYQSKLDSGNPLGALDKDKYLGYKDGKKMMTPLGKERAWKEGE